MNYLNNHEMAQERMQQFVNEADEIRRARQFAGKKTEYGFFTQVRNVLVRTISAIVR